MPISFWQELQIPLRCWCWWHLSCFCTTIDCCASQCTILLDLLFFLMCRLATMHSKRLNWWDLENLDLVSGCALQSSQWCWWHPFTLSFSNEASVLLPIDYCAGSYSSSNLAESVVRLGDAEDDPINVSFRRIECSWHPRIVCSEHTYWLKVETHVNVQVPKIQGAGSHLYCKIWGLHWRCRTFLLSRTVKGVSYMFLAP